MISKSSSYWTGESTDYALKGVRVVKKAECISVILTSSVSFVQLHSFLLFLSRSLRYVKLLYFHYRYLCSFVLRTEFIFSSATTCDSISGKISLLKHMAASGR